MLHTAAVRRPRTLLAVLLVLLGLLAAACTKPEQPKLSLTWDGAAVQGAAFTEIKAEQVTVHYTAPTVAEVAQRVADRVSNLVKTQTSEWGRMDPAESVQVWIVPGKQAWPAGLAAPPAGRRARAAAPHTVVLMEEGVWDTAAAGLNAAVGLAITQAKESPVYQVDWLHEGMAAIMANPWSDFPLTQWKATEKRPAGELFRALKADPSGDEKDYRLAAASLAALVTDRWGAGWTAHYPRPAAELTPEAALLWATGGKDEAAALALWQERVDFVLSRNYNRPGLVNATAAYVPTIADVSPVRMEPTLAALPQGPGPNANYSQQSYVINARYEPSQRSVSGELKLTWKNGEGVPVDTLYFNLWPNADQYARFGGGITVQGARVDGKEAAFDARALDLKLPLGRPVAPGETITAELTFVTRLPAMITMRVFGQQGAERFNLAHWFPILAALDDRGWVLTPLPTIAGEPYSENASFQVTLDVPAGTVVGATGTQVSRTEQNGRWVYTYDAPNVKDWVATGGKDLVEVIKVAEGVKIRVIEKDRNWAEQNAEVTAATLPVFNRKFGPYPYQELVVTCCAGLEYPGLFYSPPINPNGFWKVTIYHELAHQWFYGVVGNDQYTEAWLDEGFARYAERLGVRTFGPPEQLRDMGVPVREFKGGAHVSSSSREFTYTGQYALVVYNKGALLLEDLEQLMGEEQFTRLMHEWVKQMQFRTATTAEFVRLAEQISGRDLTLFFEEHSISLQDRGPYEPLFPLGDATP